MDYIILSIPVFFILIGLEVLISKIQKSDLYRFNDAISNISCGIAQQVSLVFFKTIMIVGYVYLYDNFRLFNFEENLFTWVLLFIGVDFFYYWFHRYSHEINLFWGAHIVHHQSEEYNLSVALRQSSFQGFISTIFYLPLAIIGFHPVSFITVNAFQTLYQFWIHTKTIDKMPAWFEYLFNTPSHHRVHHGRNPKYIDKNHGGTLIIFDRWFGTFQEEEEEVVYGVTKPLSSWNPIWANFDYYAEMWQFLKKPMSVSDKIRYLFAMPGWRPAHLGGYNAAPPISSGGITKYDTEVPMSLNYYVFFQYGILLLITSLFLFNLNHFDLVEKAIFTTFIILTIISAGGILENRRWTRIMEGSRFVMLVYMAFVLLAGKWWLLGVVIVYVIISMFWLQNQLTRSTT